MIRTSAAAAKYTAFIMKTRTAVDYAVRRTQTHLRRFTGLWTQLNARAIDETWLSQLEEQDNIFPELDYRVYA